MVPLGTKAPDFLLPDTVSGISINFAAIKGEQGTVVMFICNHCPFVVHVNQELVLLGKEYLPKGIGFVAISANDIVKHPGDAPEHMKIIAEKLQYPFPYCYDETQETAKAYGAACTPDFFVYDKNDDLVYRGQLDDSRPGNKKPVTGADMRFTLNSILQNRPVSSHQHPSIGCNIKWKE